MLLTWALSQIPVEFEEFQEFVTHIETGLTKAQGQLPFDHPINSALYAEAVSDTIQNMRRLFNDLLQGDETQ